MTQTALPGLVGIRSTRAGKSGYGSALTASQRLTLLTIWITLLGSFWWDLRVSPSIMKLGSYNLSIQDPAFVVTLLALGAVLGKTRLHGKVILVPIAGLLLIAVLDLARGIVTDPIAALTWLRADGALAPLLLLALTVPYSERLAQRINWVFFIVATLLCGLFFFRLAIDRELFMAEGGLEANEGRLISVHGAMILVIASGLLLLNFLRNSRRLLSLFASLGFFLVTLASGQGTATICAIAVYAIVFGFDGGRFPLLRFFVVGGGIAAVALALVIGPDTLMGAVNSDWVSHRVGNIGFREAIWRELLSTYRADGLLNQLIGIPAGPNRTLIVEQFFGNHFQYQEWQGSMHSMYIGSLARFGAFGLLLYSGIILAMFVRLFVMAKYSKPTTYTFGISLALLTAALILGYSYELRGEELMLLFLPLLYLGRREARAGEMATVRRRRLEPALP